MGHGTLSQLDPHGIPAPALSALLSVSVALSSSLDLDPVLQTAIESACDLLGLETGAIYLLDGESMYLGATTPPLEPGFPDEFRHARLDDHPHAREAISTVAPLYIADMRSAPLSSAERHVSEVRALRSLLYLPLQAEEHSIGVMILGTTGEVRDFDDEAVELARIFATQASLAVANARLHESVRQANMEVRHINEHLEQLVDERTEELACANEELQCQAMELEERAVELEEQTAELEEANDAKARFLRSMSHELRTPLNSIIGFSGMMLQGLAGELNDEQRKQLGMVHGAGNHLLAIMADLLDLCRIDAGALKISIAPLDVPELVDECIRSVTQSITGRDLSLSLRLPAECPPLRSDPVRIRQILLNLIDNAVKYTAEGSVEVEVFYPDAETVSFSVRDTGPGIPPEKLEAIFGEFEQVLASRDRTVAGTGLGLAISRGLAIALGGTITAESEPGSGSTFTLVIPRVTDPLIGSETSR